MDFLLNNWVIIVTIFLGVWEVVGRLFPNVISKVPLEFVKDILGILKSILDIIPKKKS